MTMTGIRTIDHSLTTTKAWLKDVQEELSLADEEQAFEITRAVLHTLRDRLRPQEAADFAAQLPMLLQGVYYHEWTPHDKPLKIRSRDAFLELISERLRGKYPPQAAARGVFKVLTEHVTPGEIEDVKSNLPPEIRQLWPES